MEAILSAESVSSRERLMRIRELLKNLRDVDLARGLSRIQYSKVGRTISTWLSTNLFAVHAERAL